MLNKIVKTDRIPSIHNSPEEECGQQEDTVHKLECATCPAGLVEEPMDIEERGAPAQHGLVMVD